MRSGRHWIMRETGVAGGVLAILLLVLLVPFHHALAAQQGITGQGQGPIALCSGETVHWPDDRPRLLPECPLCHLTTPIALPAPPDASILVPSRPSMVVHRVAEDSDRPADRPTSRQRARGPPCMV